MTDHMGSTCAHHYPHTKFHQCSPYRTLDMWFFVISQSEQIWKWGIKYAHLVTTDHMGSTCAPYYPHTKFDENRSLHSHKRVKVYLLMLTRSYIHPSIHLSYRQHYKWKLSDPSSTKWSFQHSWRPTKKQTNKQRKTKNKKKTRFGSQGSILLNSGDGPVYDPGNGSGWERIVFLQCGYFFTVRG